MLNCGLVRERGMARPSTTTSMFCARNNSTSSAIERVECPMVKNCDNRGSLQQMLMIFDHDAVSQRALPLPGRGEVRSRGIERSHRNYDAAAVRAQLRSE